ncbi:hypothetical protein BCR34DRAFT_573432 [Clohesyomyces aquaticus]|uniref:Uncharacterized protein n=1 Tax=Clohesyomyces aquaticus TaxID=1231657 RepID=A0A1Y1YZV8_9PLEO|nr:hypothetical protein BCR34DRAFT_573432 [Clohesyomyces aquaticus]
MRTNDEVGGHIDANVDADVDTKLVASYVGMLQLLTETKYFVSESGYLGIGSSAVVPGDLVVLIFGCGMSYLLRPDGSGKHRLIGDAYVHGIMEGELMAQSYATQSFTIC